MDHPTQLPDPVQELIRERIHSVEELEALLLLRSEPSRWWSDGEVAQSLRLAPALVRPALSSLVEHGLARAANGDQGPTMFGPEAAGLEEAVRELAEAYDTQRVEVLVFISRSAISRVRKSALRTFAEAFRISERKKDG